MKAVYIMSSPRGGSTLLSLVLGRHPEIANLGEVSFIPKLLALDELCTCQQRLNQCSEWEAVFRLVQQSTGVDMLDAPYALHLDDAMKHKFGTGKIDYQYQTKWRMARAKLLGGIDDFLLRYSPANRELLGLKSILNGIDNTFTLYNAAAKIWKSSVVVDASKLPRKAIHLYRQAPDDVRIIHLTRDSRGVCASCLPNMNLRFAARRWKHYHALSLGLLKKWVAPEHVIRIKYEDFLETPATHLDKICEWLDVSYVDQFLNFGTDITAHSAGGNLARFRFSDDGILPADESWRSSLTEADLDKIERICGDVSRQLGYSYD